MYRMPRSLGSTVTFLTRDPVTGRPLTSPTGQPTAIATDPGYYIGQGLPVLTLIPGGVVAPPPPPPPRTGDGLMPPPPSGPLPPPIAPGPSAAPWESPAPPVRSEGTTFLPDDGGPLDPAIVDGQPAATSEGPTVSPVAVVAVLALGYLMFRRRR